MKSAPQVDIFTDGACSGNPGPGGWAAILRVPDRSSGEFSRREKEIAGSEPSTTNNRMELTAVIKALEALKMPTTVTIYTDSKYVLDGATRWLPRWKLNGWRTTDKKPVKNDDLWRALDTASSTHTLFWKWVAGHSGHVENERVDALARAAIRSRTTLKDKIS